jgi:hypothetical protein
LMDSVFECYGSFVDSPVYDFYPTSTRLDRTFFNVIF